MEFNYLDGVQIMLKLSDMTYLNDGILYTIVYATKWFIASNIFIISLFKSVHSDVNLK